MLKEYEELLPHSPKLTEFRPKVRDITELLADHLDELRALSAQRPTRIGYQAPCHLLHAQKIVEAPLAVIQSVRNVTVTPLAENEICCGSAGTYNIEHPSESEKLVTRKLSAIERDKPDIVLTANAGCLLQLRKGIREAKNGTPIYHIIEWLDSLLPTAQ
jgi:glycolate oxidase iron-sulfur subunit